MRRPVISSNTSRQRSRARNPLVMAVRAPSSMPPVASHTQCEDSRLISIIITRISWARARGHAEQLLDAEAVGRLVEERRQVIGPGQERDALGPGAELGVLLDPGVQ